VKCVKAAWVAINLHLMPPVRCNPAHSFAVFGKVHCKGNFPMYPELRDLLVTVNWSPTVYGVKLGRRLPFNARRRRESLAMCRPVPHTCKI
jgi:hypothetical protein